MSISTSFADSNLKIAISGDFDSQLINDFKQAYEKAEPTPKAIIIDLKDTSYIDSSALGMLIALREYAQAIQADVYIKNMNEVVLEIFRVLNFHKLFKPEYDQTAYAVSWCFHPESE